MLKPVIIVRLCYPFPADLYKSLDLLFDDACITFDANCVDGGPIDKYTLDNSRSTFDVFRSAIDGFRE